MNAVVPNITAQHLAKRPFLAITACYNLVFQKIRFLFNRFKPSFATFIYVSVVICRNVDFTKIIGVYFFGVFLHFFCRARNISVKSLARGKKRFVLIGDGFVKRKKIPCGFQRNCLQSFVFIDRKGEFFLLKYYIGIRVTNIQLRLLFADNLNLQFFGNSTT